MFDEHLISPWRTRGGGTRSSAHALLLDRGSHYEIRMATVTADPGRIEAEVNERRLRGRVPGPAGPVENVFSFESPVDCDAVSARWLHGILHIVLPKKKARRISIK